jgi:hypothetical protein
LFNSFLRRLFVFQECDRLLKEYAATHGGEEGWTEEEEELDKR